jgi:hypothetical protein
VPLKGPILALLPALLASCSDDPPVAPLSEFPYAMATPACGPADGPVVLIYLASTAFEQQPSAPFVEVHIPKSFADVGVGAVFPVSESFSDANAWFRGSGVERTANGGEVGVTSKSTMVLSGYIDLRFTDGFRLRGSFFASWVPRQMLCG